jgi:hypothetical protein
MLRFTQGTDTIYFNIRFKAYTLRNSLLNLNPGISIGGKMILDANNLAQVINLPPGCEYDIVKQHTDISSFDNLTMNNSQLKFTLKPDVCSTSITIRKDCEDGCPEQFTLYVYGVNMSSRKIPTCNGARLQMKNNCDLGSDDMKYVLQKLNNNE